MQRDARRRFSRAERAALLAVSDGLCGRCGDALGPDWQADHIEPHSRGGRTAIWNGQALCRQCNQEKGDSMVSSVAVPAWPESWEMRGWQREAHLTYFATIPTQFTVTATPGAGKSLFALRVTHDMLEQRHVSRVVIVVPSEHLRAQWQEAAHSAGLQLATEFGKDAVLAPDYHGVVVTYQQVAARRNLGQIANVSRQALAIFDEIHHAGDQQNWGAALLDSFRDAPYKLALTGTPFRSDNQPIPFITYVDGVSISDYAYTYGRALQDGVCRPVFFPTYDGEMRWVSGGDGAYTATFSDEVPTKEESNRLATALDPNGGWLETVIRDADGKLLNLRATYEGPESAAPAGLVIAKDQNHARAIVRLVTRVTGTRPVLVISDEPESSATLHKFRESGERWLVSVRKVSEGVDIKRLHVLVYATNIMTEMYFRQAVGRIVRVARRDASEEAWCFAPKIGRLVEYMTRIKEERDHVLDGEEVETTPRERDPLGDDLAAIDAALFQPLGSTGRPDAVYFDGAAHAQVDLDAAREVLRKAGLEGVNEVIAARIIKAAREIDQSPPRPVDAAFEVPVTPAAVQPQPHAMPLQARKLALRQRIKKLHGILARMLNTVDRDTYPADYKRYEGELFKRLNWSTYQGKKAESLTLEELEACIRSLDERIADLRGGRQEPDLC